MLCSQCSYQNGPHRITCKQCRRRLSEGMSSGHVATVEDRTVEAQETLRTGAESEKFAARDYLAEVLESRGKYGEAIELLVANAQAGMRTTATYRRLSELYLRIGQSDQADLALAEAAKLDHQNPAELIEGWSADQPVPLKPMDRPESCDLHQLQAISTQPSDHVDALLASIRKYGQFANDLRYSASSKESLPSTRDKTDALITEGQALISTLDSPDLSMGRLASQHGWWRGLLAWVQIWLGRKSISRAIASLNALRFEVGLSLGEDWCVQHVLRRELARQFPGVMVSVENGRAQIKCAAPANRVPRFSVTAGHRQGQTVRRERPARDINREYKDLLAEHARSLAVSTFALAPSVDLFSLSVVADIIDPMKGRPTTVCLLAVELERSNFCDVVHENVQAENALKNGQLRFSYDGKSFELHAVHPFTITSRVSSSEGGIDLDRIDPIAFEELVRRLLERIGFEARTTKTSHDGGIDVIAVNPQPIIGGTVIVQCKRYSHVVGAPVVRDLYGALTHEGASKGILITTSWYSPDARRFAQDKPIELIDREKLQQLLDRYQLRM